MCIWDVTSTSFTACIARRLRTTTTPVPTITTSTKATVGNPVFPPLGSFGPVEGELTLPDSVAIGMDREGTGAMRAGIGIDGNGSEVGVAVGTSGRGVGLAAGGGGSTASPMNGPRDSLPALPMRIIPANRTASRPNILESVGHVRIPYAVSLARDYVCGALRLQRRGWQTPPSGFSRPGTREARRVKRVEIGRVYTLRTQFALRDEPCPAQIFDPRCGRRGSSWE